MNEQQLAKSERLASTIMRVLAIIGLVATLALIAWAIVQGIRFVPNAGERMSAAVTSVSSVFRSAPSESLTLELDSRTINTGDTTELRFAYTGATSPSSYEFSYTCADGVTLVVHTTAGNRDLACATPLSFSEPRARVAFTSSKTRFADVTLTVTSGALKDTTVVTLVNSVISNVGLGTTTPTVASTTTASTTKATTTTKAAAASSKPAVAKPVSTTKTTTPKQPVDVPVVNLKPADLALAIKDTGIIGGTTFFPLSPIPSNKIAAVVFTVTNTGDKPSGTWAFKAWLPTEGNPTYRYTSPLQASLLPGMQVEYTLGFDQVVNATKGTINVELATTDKTDNAGNNADSVNISIR
jgi:hypothetical protein